MEASLLHAVRFMCTGPRLPIVEVFVILRGRCPDKVRFATTAIAQVL
jgi:hypothetical protein